MVRIRRLEERCAELSDAMKIRGFRHRDFGAEMDALGIVEARSPDGAFVATYRGHVYALGRGTARTLARDTARTTSGTQ